MAKSRRRRIVGIVPSLGRGVAGAGRWLFRHPQPFVLAIGLAGGIWGAWTYAHEAEAFRITRVDVAPQSSLKLPDGLIGANLWGLDVQLLADTLQRQQPWLQEVRVIRQPPNVLRIEVIERRLVAQVLMGKWYGVDANGFILPNGQAEPNADLVQLLGAHSGAAPLKAGQSNTAEKLQLGLRMLNTLKGSRVLMARKLAAIDVSQPEQLRFVLQPSIEVRCGSEAELAAQLDQLRGILTTIARQRVEVAYIDLRFQEPVISPMAAMAGS